VGFGWRWFAMRDMSLAFIHILSYLSGVKDLRAEQALLPLRPAYWSFLNRDIA